MEPSFPRSSRRAPFKIRRGIDFTQHQKQCTVLTSNLMLKETLLSCRCGMIWMIHESLWTVWKWGTEKWSVMLSSTAAAVVATVFLCCKFPFPKTGKGRLDKRTYCRSGVKWPAHLLLNMLTLTLTLTPRYFVVFVLNFNRYFKLVFRFLFAAWIIFCLGLVNVP